jgi:hypothetical protein
MRQQIYHNSIVVPPEAIGIMLDVPGAGTTTMVIPADELDALLAEVGNNVASHMTLRLADRQWHADLREDLARQLKAAFQRDDRNATQNCTCLALWLLFNHPTAVGGLRRALSRELRANGNAHLTITIDMKGRMVEGVGTHFFNQREDLAEVARSVPSDVDIAIEQLSEDPLQG